MTQASEIQGRETDRSDAVRVGETRTGQTGDDSGYDIDEAEVVYRALSRVSRRQLRWRSETDAVTGLVPPPCTTA